MKKWLRWIIAALILVALVFWGVWRYVNKGQPDYSKKKPEYSMSAADLYNDFKKDRTLADKKYTGKVIEISGPVTKIESTDTSAIAVFVFNQGMFGDEGLRCILLPGGKEKAKTINPGSNIKLKGFCTGATDSDVIIEKGSFVE